MTKHKTEDIRNVALVGHGAVGKTTLADLMLFKAGAATRAGSVDDGTSLLDTDDDEKEHKHSISSAVCHFTHAGKRINLIDTPGYPDFIGRAIGALRAVETAVITVSATAGIEVNTRRMFDLAGKAGIGRMVLVNKCDLENVNFAQLARADPGDIRPGVRAAQRSRRARATISAGRQHAQRARQRSRGDRGADPAALNQTVMDAIVEADEALMERYLEGERALRRRSRQRDSPKPIAAGTLIPIFCSSSKTGVGVARVDGRAGPYRTLADRRCPAPARTRPATTCPSIKQPTVRSSRRCSRRASIRSSPR